ncbi:helix-turn-helix transcriptional regulator [Specibacter cremeus]|uniref:helix-turn-helix transcriptional regulator n=1 Tax=Specibacter cremeus TaxID=1629051 RepID=UPI001F0B857E|nr:helix-turn-helix domain-containing protein [Specibacter cremeus]
MAQLDESERLAAVAALGDPVRRDLFEVVRRAGTALSCDDCAEELGLPRSTVRVQLDRLVAAGLLSTKFRKTGPRQGPGSGRPAKLYTAALAEVAASVPDRHYDLAADLLAAAVQHSADASVDIREAVAAVAYDAGTGLGARAGSIEAMLDATGYDPHPDGAGGTILANCPFHALARRHTDVVCSLNGSLLAGALAGCGDTGHRVVEDSEPTHCCARIVPYVS